MAREQKKLDLIYFAFFVALLTSTVNCTRSSGLLGSIKVPHTINDALDPAQHCILHHAVPAGVRSNTLIRKIEKFDETATPEHVVLRATIPMITYGGYFLEYVYNVNHQNKSSWTLEREFNLLTAETSSLP
ncbi:hypothetical protein MTR67_029810 [Solanum verrucosum]|uniref:Uncharacterized protein n=1 Tax=Solanum verrucosum TaxID=315347 RepID=A0AAF0R8V2_SOLVR|nr:hypothetical protein MTR67_029810 [Solanum verrucosum]